MEGMAGGNGSGLLNDNVWALTQLPDGTVAIGTLGSGVQLYDPRADKFTDTYNTKNSKILSDYISSMTVSHDGRLIISHSEGLAFIDLKTRNIENVRGNHAGVAFSSQLINQVFEDSRASYGAPRFQASTHITPRPTTWSPSTTW